MQHHYRLIAAILGAVLFGVPLAWGQTLPPLAEQLNPAETAILLVDFQNTFAAPDGEHYANYRKDL